MNDAYEIHRKENYEDGSPGLPDYRTHKSSITIHYFHHV